MLSFPIAPRHKRQAAYRAGQPNGTRFNSTWSTATPVTEIVSSGPWILQSYQPAQRIVYRRNPNFWEKDAQGRKLPYLDRYVLLIDNDLASVRRKFLSGNVDAFNLPASAYGLFKRGESGGNYRVFDLRSDWGFSFLGFNLNPRARVDASKRKLFQNVLFRRAVSDAIDRDAIVRNLFAGRAQPLYGPRPPADTVFYNPRVPRYSHDVAQARRLLRRIGLRDANRNGLLEWQGREVKINIITNIENGSRREMSRQIARDLRKVGLNMTVTGLGFNDLVRKLDSARDGWETVVLGFSGGPEPHESANVWMSSGSLHLWNPAQKTPATRWEAQVDELFRRGAQTLDEAERKRIYNRWQVIVAQQQPLIFLVAPNRQVAIRNRFANAQPFSFSNTMWNLEEIYQRRKSN